jgi:membrane-associated phospholipid phosphatase
MVSDLLGLNWSLFEAINGQAGQNSSLDGFMVFSAQDLIFLLPLLFLALWIGVMRWPLFASRAPRRAPLARSPFALSTEDRSRALGQQLVLLTVVSVAVALAVNLVLAHLVAEPRPFVSHPAAVHKLIPHASGNGFPSDHETVASALAWVLALYAFRLVLPSRDAHGLRRRPPAWLLVLAVPLALLGLAMAFDIGLARVYCGVHYPVDIAGGMFCGLVGGLSALGARRFTLPILTPVLQLTERLRLA